MGATLSNPTLSNVTCLFEISLDLFNLGVASIRFVKE